MTSPAPIFVMSFNRPDYLRAVLASLRAQTGSDIEGRDIYLFQDGAVNAVSGLRHATDEDIAASVAVFREAFPRGTVMEAPANLGVALNFDRAETFGFETLGAESIVFLEDDMVLAPHYLQMLDALTATHADDPRVGYVAAYGNHHVRDLAEQRARRHEIALLYHNWAFALYRRHWLLVRPHVRAYLDLVTGVDYRLRDGPRIRALFQSWGYANRGTSQDVAKTLACCREGVVKINTVTCNARYIGKEGLHMRPEDYGRLRFADTTLYPEPVLDWAPLDDDSHGRLLSAQLAWAEVPRAPVTIRDTDFIRAVYRGLLGRAPDPSGQEAMLELLRRGEPPERVLRTILKSREFRQRTAAALAEAAPAGTAASAPATQTATETGDREAGPARGERPAREKPVRERPVREKPVREKPARERPLREKPVRDQAARERPARERPDRERPDREKPAREKPRRDRPERPDRPGRAARTETGDGQ